MNSYTDYDEEDYVREPDMPIREQLTEDTRSKFDKQLDDAVYLSMLEIAHEDELNQMYEKQLIEEYEQNELYEKQIMEEYKRQEAEETLQWEEEYNNRIKEFAEFNINLTRVSNFDKNTAEIAPQIHLILHHYYNQSASTYAIALEEYNQLFNVISRIRISPKALEILKKIVVVSV
jgi:hypothetical protein